MLSGQVCVCVHALVARQYVRVDIDSSENLVKSSGVEKMLLIPTDPPAKSLSYRQQRDLQHSSVLGLSADLRVETGTRAQYNTSGMSPLALMLIKRRALKKNKKKLLASFQQGTHLYSTLYFEVLLYCMPKSSPDKFPVRHFCHFRITFCL